MTKIEKESSNQYCEIIPQIITQLYDNDNKL